jgi:TRAP-type C4-dicarboxylate transport system permease small subunit
MPKLIRLYIKHVIIGFGISALFLGAMIWLDVANLRHLLLQTPSGWLAAFMIFMFQGSIFAGVQFGIAVMGMAEKPEGPKGGSKAPVATSRPAPVRLTSK